LGLALVEICLNRHTHTLELSTFTPLGVRLSATESLKCYVH